MDTLTHALSAMLAARAIQPKAPRPGELSLTARSWVGFFAGAFPDSDFVLMAFGTSTYLNYHRGITHSILLLPVWALLLAWAFSLIMRRRYRWRAFYTTCLLGVFVHIFGDVITSYGTMVLSPFSDYRLAFPTTFIIDWYFSGIIIVGLIASYASRRYKQQFAMLGFCVLLGYVLAQAWWSRMARIEAYKTLPAKIIEQAKVVALPQPVSPFNWKLIVETPDRYYVRYLNLFRHTALHSQDSDSLLRRIDALYLPRREVAWEVIPRYGADNVKALAKRVWQAPAMADIRHFMEYPAVQRVSHDAQANCVWFADQRFVLRNLRAPFIFGGCESGESKQLRIGRLQDDRLVPLD